MISRRNILKSLGFCIALPIVESALPRLAYAQGTPKKKRFIGCFFGSGSTMPGGANGDWAYSGNAGGALKPLADLRVNSNVSILRGYRAINNYDVHWSGTASFLSSTPIGVASSGDRNDPAYQRCAKTMDQLIADKFPDATIRSLHAGYSALAGWDQSHDRVASINYVNSIAWRDPSSPISNINDPMQLFTRVFGSGNNVSNAEAIFLMKRRQSILDGVLDQYNLHKSTLGAADRQKLEAFAQSLREVEGELSSVVTSTCTKPSPETAGETYVRNFRTIHKIIITAMQCDLTHVATIMYNDGIGRNYPTTTVRAEQHDSAHNDWAKLILINQIQVGLWGELIAGLKTAGLLKDTVTILGSNMSDGRSHSPVNIPLLIASENMTNELKLGQEIYAAPAASVTDRNQNRNLADLHVDLLKLYGVNVSSFGSGSYASTGKPSGIFT